MSNAKPQGVTDNSRRSFLKLTTMAAPAVAVASMTGATAAEAQDVVLTGSDVKMRTTEHTAEYLKSLKF